MIDHAETAPRTTVLAFHFPHKTASMFAYKILKEMAHRFPVQLYSQNDAPPRHAQLPQAISKAARDEANRRFLRGPVRGFAMDRGIQTDDDTIYRFYTPEGLLKTCRYLAVCQRRDPLDQIVSQYFSHGWIHRPHPRLLAQRESIRSGEIGLYGYALLSLSGEVVFGQESIVEKYNDLNALEARIGSQNTLRLSYETMMLDYPAWAEQIADFVATSMGGPLRLGRLREMLLSLKPDWGAAPEHRTFYPDTIRYVEENQHEMQHIRSPWPGDHKRFFTRVQIADLRERIAVLES